MGHPCTTMWTKTSLEITLSLTVTEIFTLFYFALKSMMAAKSGKNGNFSLLHKIPLYCPVGQKFAQNLTVSETFSIFYLPLKSKIAAKSSVNLNF